MLREIWPTSFCLDRLSYHGPGEYLDGTRLVIGTFATIRDIIWSATDVDPLHTRPGALIVTVDGYTGPAWKTDDQGRALLPILPVTRTSLIDGP
ncbi:uncharacterized protein N7515_006154 [Penicillium bovifimosum]|uniref:Uncharacterized protein n=1 Tax=Penicillium bovifimosum TaxID=126998 RepID=A0A9W9L0U5_9EURO|nr:uncharacterized protein N7515_006154 [Penicillium bovifimosum]KAJ5130115.1 hypothetical protein N7515_006154 [Penicillium bovifimosum]